MPETLLTQSAVKMYGRVLKGVALTPLAAGDTSDLGFNKFLRHQLLDKGEKEKESPAMLARIYAFSFEGTFYNLPRPAIFLVHGKGRPIRGSGTYDEKAAPWGPAVLDDSGIPAREFVFETDVVYWEYDKDDISLRLDSFSGTLDEILIEDSLSPASRSAIVSRSAAVSDSDVAMRHRLR